MYTASTVLALLALISASLAGPIQLSRRQTEIPCFLIGNADLPKEVADIAAELADTISCSSSSTTLSGVPDVSSNGVSFSSISFDDSSLSPLGFAIEEFSTPSPLASADLGLFQDRLDTYLATEVGIRSVGGGLAIKLPKFFLAFQVARIKTAQGIEITDPGQTVDHLLGKVLKNGPRESAALMEQVKTLAKTLS